MFMILNDSLQNLLEVFLAGVLLAEKLEFTWHFLEFVVFVFHRNELMQCLKLVESLIGPDDQLPVDIDLNDVFLGYGNIILYV